MFKNYKNFSSFIHPEGFIIILLAAVATLLVASVVGKTYGWIGVIFTIWCMYFFRNPERIVPLAENLVVSPADGLVVDVSYSTPPQEVCDENSDEMLKISIFLNIFNVHVNRVPADGKIIKLHYNPGKFVNASLDKASIHNERQTILMENSKSQKIVFVQIAGLVARRIVCDLEESMEVKRGERFGIIRFGSRVDVYLPKNISPKVAVGQTMIGGETILADLSDEQEKNIIFKPI